MIIEFLIWAFEFAVQEGLRDLTLSPELRALSYFFKTFCITIFLQLAVAFCINFPNFTMVIGLIFCGDLYSWLYFRIVELRRLELIRQHRLLFNRTLVFFDRNRFIWDRWMAYRRHRKELDFLFGKTASDIELTMEKIQILNQFAIKNNIDPNYSAFKLIRKAALEDVKAFSEYKFLSLTRQPVSKSLQRLLTTIVERYGTPHKLHGKTSLNQFRLKELTEKYWRPDLDFWHRNMNTDRFPRRYEYLHPDERDYSRQHHVDRVNSYKEYDFFSKRFNANEYTKAGYDDVNKGKERYSAYYSATQSVVDATLQSYICEVEEVVGATRGVRLEGLEQLFKDPVDYFTGIRSDLEMNKEFLYKLAEDCILFLFMLWRAYKTKDKTGLILTVIIFIKMRCGNSSLTTQIVDKTIRGVTSLLESQVETNPEMPAPMAYVFDKVYNIRGKWYYPNGEPVANTPIENLEFDMVANKDPEHYIRAAEELISEGLFDNYTIKFMEDKNLQFRSFLENFELFSQTPCYKKIYSSYMYLLAFGIFSKFGLDMDNLGFEKLAQEKLRSTHGSKSSAIYTFIDTASFLFGRGIQMVKTGSLDPIYHSGASYDKWFSEAQMLIQKSKLLNSPTLLGMSESEFLGRLNSCIEQGQSIFIKIKDLNKSSGKYVHAMLDQLLCAQVDLLSSAHCLETRKVPFSLLIAGNSSVGKTMITDVLFKAFGRLQKLPTDDMYKHTRNPGAKFWDNFKTYMWFIRMDDIAFMNPAKAPQGDPSLMELLQIVNAVPFTPDQADLKDKGRTPVKAALVIATTNTKNLNCHHYFSCPSAVQRRFPYIITPTLKQEYNKDNGLYVSPGSETFIPDYWTFTVEEVRPPLQSMNSSENAFYRTMEHKGKILKDISMKELLTWFSSVVKKHDSVNDQIEQSKSNLDVAEICEDCEIFRDLCGCPRRLRSESMEIILDKIVWYTGLFYTLNFLCKTIYSFLRLYACYMFVSYCKVTVTTWYYGIYGRLSYSWRRFSGQVSSYSPAVCVRTTLRQLGDRLERRNNIPSAAIAALAILSSVGVGAYIMTSLMKTTMQTEGSVLSTVGCAPTAKREERNNVWYNEHFEVTSHDLPVAIGSIKQYSEEQVRVLIQRNLVHLKIVATKVDGSISVVSPRALGVGGHMYVSNSHCFPVDAVKYDVVMTQSRQNVGLTDRVHFVLYPEKMLRQPEKDLVYFNVYQVPPKRKLSKFFCKESYLGKFHAYYLGRNDTGDIERVGVSYCSLEDTSFNQKEIGKSPHPAMNFKGWKGTSEGTFQGFCGSLLIGNTSSGPMLMGIHSLGDKTKTNNTSIATRITAEDIEKAAKNFTEFYVDTNAPDLSTESGEIIPIQPLHFKSPLRYIQEGVCLVYGSLSNGRATMKSKVVPTPMASFLKETFGMVQKFGAPKFSERPWLPWRTALLDQTSIIDKFDERKLDQCVYSFYMDVMHNISVDSLNDLHVYDLFTAINGAAGVAYVDGVKKNTSAGWPWNKTKKVLIKKKTPTESLPEAFEFDDEVNRRVEDLLKNYQEGIRGCPIFVAHLKDEAVKWAKILIGKYRVFSGASLPFTLIERMYLLPFIRVMQNNRFIFEAAPGTNAMSPEWEEYYTYLTYFGTNRIVAGDYKAFDKTMSSRVILCCFRFIIMVCTEGLYSSEDIRVISCIAIDIAFAYTNFNGDLVQFFGSNPSGHALTVTINCIAGSLYVRYAYLVLNPKEELESFKDNVHLVVYGDDNIMGISEDAPWFNHCSISEVLGNLGITYTMADKESASVPYIHIDDATFLKRSWKYCDEIGMHTCPLDLDSIEKSLLTWVASPITPEEHMLAVLSSAWREYAYHGREVFRCETKKILAVVEKFQLRETEVWNDNYFPSWRVIMKQFSGEGVSYYNVEEVDSDEC